MKTRKVDQLIPEKQRRFQGSFYTPTLWVEEAHRFIESSFGKDWKEKFVVWDPAAGTFNLTRDYKFSNLFCSTLNQTDFDLCESYNSRAIKFQFDFLNDPDTKFPSELKQALAKPCLPEEAFGLRGSTQEKKPFLFFLNPPFGTSKTLDPTGTSKTGIAKTQINLAMKKDKWSGSGQLFTQFLYRITQLKKFYGIEVNLAFFAKPNFLTGSSYKKFRVEFFKHFKFEKAFLFQASEFSGVKGAWGISFSIWKPGVETRTEFPHTLKIASNLNAQDVVPPQRRKVLYNLDQKEAMSHWIREPVKGLETEDVPPVTSALHTVDVQKQANIAKGSCGYFYSNTNAIYGSPQKTVLFSTFYSKELGVSILPANFLRICTNFAVRRLIKGNWINDKDEYIAPAEAVQTNEYKQFVKDSIVYSLFNTASQQSSMRNITYKEKLWDIKNEFFWLSNAKMRELAEEHSFNDLYQDTKNFPEDRYVFKLLKNLKLSEDAQQVLNEATRLLEKTFEFREMLHEIDPDLHLNAWDAGWYQIVRILKAYNKEELKTFRDFYNNVFSKRMRPLVYKLGFLRAEDYIYTDLRTLDGGRYLNKKKKKK